MTGLPAPEKSRQPAHSEQAPGLPKLLRRNSLAYDEGFQEAAVYKTLRNRPHVLLGGKGATQFALSVPQFPTQSYSAKSHSLKRIKYIILRDQFR